jgi:hypothetical protein
MTELTQCKYFSCTRNFNSGYVCEYIMHRGGCNPECKLYQCCRICSNMCECPDETLWKKKVKEWDSIHKCGREYS